MNKPVIEMSPTELLRYQVELLEKLANDKRVTVVDFDFSFMKWFSIFLRVVPAIVSATWAVALIAVVILEVVSVVLTGKIM